MMIKKLALALCVASLLSSCGGTKKGMSASEEAALNEQFNKEAGDRVFFAFNKSDVSAEARFTLRKQAEWLRSHESVKATVEGHCDERGTREYNLALGERRANSAKMAISQLGISGDRLETVSYGKERPAAIGNTEADYKLNRRAVTVVR